MKTSPETVNKGAQKADKEIRMNRFFWVTAFLISIAAPQEAGATIYNKSECDASIELKQRAADREDKKLADLRRRHAQEQNEGVKKGLEIEISIAVKQAAEAATRLEEARDKCAYNQRKLETERTTCTQKMQQQPFWKWNEKEQKCDNLAEKKESVGNDDCSKANLYANSSLKGQNCKIARDTVEEVQERNKALNEITVTGATSVAQIQAMASSGQQQDAQKRANKMLMGLSLARLATGLSQGAGAVQLRNAASDAEDASTRMNNAYKQIDSVCANPAGNLTREECFYKNASTYGISPDKSAYAQYLSGGASQAEDAAKAASNAATGSTITGLADTLVGLQALQMARQADKNANNMTSLPPPRVIGIAPIRGASTAPNLGGFNTGTTPTDYGNPSDSGTTLGNIGGGNIRGGLKDGKSFGGTPFVSAKSTVSPAGGGSGGGAGRGGGGQSKAPNRGKTLGNTAVGEYMMGGGGGQGFKGGSSKDDKDSGGNAFADALSKLFPQDENGKPIVDGRQLASEEGAYTEEEGSTVYASDLSIFEQITAKYRQLASAGSI